MSWRRAKGLLRDVNRCPVCHGMFNDDEFSFDDDLCLYCLFPQAGKSRPADINELGQNYTKERYLLDNLDNINEKQSEKAEKKRITYKNRKLYK